MFSLRGDSITVKSKKFYKRSWWCIMSLKRKREINKVSWWTKEVSVTKGSSPRSNLSEVEGAFSVIVGVHYKFSVTVNVSPTEEWSSSSLRVKEPGGRSGWQAIVSPIMKGLAGCLPKWRVHQRKINSTRGLSEWRVSQWQKKILVWLWGLAMRSCRLDNVLVKGVESSMEWSAFGVTSINSCRRWKGLGVTFHLR